MVAIRENFMDEGKYRAYLAERNTGKRAIEGRIRKLRIVEIYFCVDLDNVIFDEESTGGLLGKIREDYLESRTAKPLTKAVEEYRDCMTKKYPYPEKKTYSYP